MLRNLTKKGEIVIMEKNFFCSWSGGKDSALSLYKAVDLGWKPQALLNILNEDGKNSRSHNLPFSILKAQADSLNIPLVTKNATWDDYEKIFIEALKEFKKQGIDSGVFGDIDIKDHRKWEEMVCEKAGLKAHLPLWNQSREELLFEFLDLGFITMIVVVNQSYLGKKYLGEIIDKELIAEFKKIGIDPSGENGEYHTVVLDGPIFDHLVEIEKKDQVENKGYYFQNINLK